MTVKLESREVHLSHLEICKENTLKEIPGLKYLMKPFQNHKLENELNDFQSILIVSSHFSSLIQEGGKIPKKWVRGQLIQKQKKKTAGKQKWQVRENTKILEEGVIFSFLVIIATDTAFPF